MSESSQELVIMFADISGSTRIYELLGDTAARARVARSTARLAALAEANGGVAIKTIGDGVMCSFADPAQAVEAACDMQSAFEEEPPELTPAGPLSLSIRIGLHHGPIILEAGDAFGDAVNVASRVCGMAKPGQILGTADAVRHLPAVLLNQTRLIDQAPVRGKRHALEIHEILWQPNDVTWMSVPLSPRAAEDTPRLTLRYHGQSVVMDGDRSTLLIGRSRNADITLDESLASRLHVRIEQRRGKYFLTDLSTNGTYVRLSDNYAFLRREEMPLVASGAISLGRAPEDPAVDWIEFQLEGTA
jgi:adenylate cyclase